MKLADAISRARSIVAALSPHCERIEVAGSIRRCKPEVGDIEIVAIPRATDEVDLFNALELKRDRGFTRAVYQLGTIVKGCPHDGRYICINVLDAQLDLFLATRENWGLIYAIRTGSADYSHNVLAKGWVRNGYKSVGGSMTKNGVVVPVPGEADLFRLAGVPWVTPENRNTAGTA